VVVITHHNLFLLFYFIYCSPRRSIRHGGSVPSWSIWRTAGTVGSGH